MILLFCIRSNVHLAMLCETWCTYEPGTLKVQICLKPFSFLFLLQVARINSTEQRQSISAKTLSLYVNDPFILHPVVCTLDTSTEERAQARQSAKDTRMMRKSHGLHVNWRHHIKKKPSRFAGGDGCDVITILGSHLWV